MIIALFHNDNSFIPQVATYYTFLLYHKQILNLTKIGIPSIHIATIVVQESYPVSVHDVVIGFELL